jgi:uncharacterized damage-inducible protein DinB
MNEKEMLLAVWEREFRTTLKVMKSYPKEHLDLKPAEKSRKAADLLWTFVAEEHVIGDVTKGSIDFMNMPKPLSGLGEIIAAYESTHAGVVEKVKAMSDEEFQSQMPFMVGPRKPGMMRRADVLWLMVMDSVHHRGQLSVYLRMAGGKVPSIYGPTADEPWM